MTRNMTPSCWSSKLKPAQWAAKNWPSSGASCGRGLSKGLGFRPPIDCGMIRMVGKSPVMAALDEVVAKIYVASFAIYPFGARTLTKT